MIDRSKYTEHELGLIDARMCACDCGGSVAHRSKRTLYLEGHRQRRNKAKVKRAALAAGLPPSLSLASAQAATGTRDRSGDARNASAAPRKRSGQSIRISWRKAVDVVGEALGDEGAARDLLAPLLTDRQRSALTSNTETTR